MTRSRVIRTDRLSRLIDSIPLGQSIDACHARSSTRSIMFTTGRRIPRVGDDGTRAATSKLSCARAAACAGGGMDGAWTEWRRLSSSSAGRARLRGAQCHRPGSMHARGERPESRSRCKRPRRDCRQPSDRPRAR